MTVQSRSDGSIKIHGWVLPFAVMVILAIASPIITMFVALKIASTQAEARIDAVNKKAETVEEKLSDKARSIENSLAEAVKLSDEKFKTGIDSLTRIISTEAIHTREITTFQFAAIGHRIDAFEARIEKLEQSPTYSVQPRK